MKKLTLIVTLFAVIGIANANLLTNGDFEDPAGGGWSQWWGGNSNKYVTDPVDSDNCAGVWWSDDGIFQGFSIEASLYEFGGEILQISDNLLSNRKAVIRAEVGVWNPDKWAPGVGGIDVWWFQEFALNPGDMADGWVMPTAAMMIDNTTAGADFLNINLFMVDEGENPAGIAYFDNVWVEQVPEPATMALLGLGGLLLRRKRK